MDEIHDQHLYQDTKSPTIPIPTPHDSGLSTQLGRLVNVISALQLNEDPSTSPLDRETKAFLKFPEVTRNILLLFSLIDGQDACDLEKMKPKSNLLAPLPDSSGTAIQRLLHIEGRCRGLRMYVQIGLCTGLKTVDIASNDPSDISHLTPFFLPPKPNGEELFTQTLLRHHEQATHGKLTESDIKTVTATKICVPLEFSTFLHQLRNMRFVCEYLGGTSCRFTVAWDTCVEHAKKNEEHYITQAEDGQYFFGALMFDYYRCIQKFLASCAVGDVDEMDVKQLQFHTIHDRIDLHEYHPHTPRWLKRRDQDRPPPKASKKPKYDAKSQFVTNANIHNNLRVPVPAIYKDVFHPHNRHGIMATPHPDGSEM